MTDKVKRIREEVVRMHSLLPVMDGDNISVNYADRICTTLEMYIDSLQEEPKECMYTKDHYTNEDRKALCDGCEEECKFNKKEYSVNNGLDLGCGVIWKDEDPVSEKQVKELLIYKHEDKTCKENGDSLTQESVSEDLEQAIDTYLATYFGGDKEKQYWPFLKKMAINFAEWQKKKDDYAIEIAHMAGEEEGKNIMKQKMMKNAVEVPIEEAVPFGSCKWKLCAKLWLDKGVKGNKVKLVIIKDE